MKIVKALDEYKLIGMSKGMKIEKWGKYTLSRPDPQIIWEDKKTKAIKVDAIYSRSNKGGGKWSSNKLPESWNIKHEGMVFKVGLMGFKHTGLFPEQAYNWEYIQNTIEKAKETNRNIKLLNLFAYTGAASVAALKAGAEVVHLDSSRGMIEWAKDNVSLSGLQDEKIRYIVDDAKKFVQREIRRGNKYDAIILDPPSFGRGKKNEVWSFEKDIFMFMKDVVKLLSDDPLFCIINSYTTGISSKVLENILEMTFKEEEERRKIKFNGKFSSDELGIKMENSELILPAGIYGRWGKYD